MADLEARQTDLAAIRRDTRVVMFDQYGTVVDMQGGLTAHVTPYLQANGWSGNPGAFVTWWRRTMCLRNCLPV